MPSDPAQEKRQLIDSLYGAMIQMAHASTAAFALIEGAGQTVTSQPEPALLLTNHYMLWYPAGIPTFSV
jgi:hypothetical protein